MVESIARIRFHWNSEQTQCRAIAFDATGGVLAEVTVDLSENTRRLMWTTRGASLRYRLEEVAERHLRALSDLRY